MPKLIHIIAILGLLAYCGIPLASAQIPGQIAGSNPAAAPDQPEDSADDNPVDLGKLLSPDNVDRKGDDWNYLQEYFARNLTGNNKKYWESGRSLGTFWNVQAVHQWGKKQNEALGDKDCVLVFYYPGSWKQKQGLNKDNADWNQLEEYYKRPLAVSGVCKDGKRPKVSNGDLVDGDFPRADGKENRNKIDSLVFHSYYTRSVETDLYYVVRQGRNHDGDTFEDWTLDQTEDDLILLANSGEMPEFFTSDQGKENTKKEIRRMLREWANTNHKGLVPNPYKRGIGFNGWWLWSQVNFFWGFDENGIQKAGRK